MQAFELKKRARLPLLAAALVSIAWAASATLFNAERPRRILVTQAESNGRSAFLFRARDVLPLYSQQPSPGTVSFVPTPRASTMLLQQP